MKSLRVMPGDIPLFSCSPRGCRNALGRFLPIFQIVSTIAPATGRRPVEPAAHLGDGLAPAAQRDQHEDEEGGCEESEFVSHVA
jgi:hypothetical protein